MMALVSLSFWDLGGGLAAGAPNLLSTLCHTQRLRIDQFILSEQSQGRGQS
jgi:hypothetical protein